MASCPSCNADYVAGARWCSICHTNVVNPEIGRLSSPGRRLSAYCLDSFYPHGSSNLVSFLGLSLGIQK